MTSELKPCPFCGGACNILRDEPIPGAGFVECAECGARGGISRPNEAVRLWNARAATTIGKVQVEIEPVLRGTLTAEQVRDAVMSVDRWEKPMGDTGLTNTHLIIRSDGWQAIADELNCRAERTCRNVDEYADSGFFTCGVCGFGNNSIELTPNYCPACGAKVIAQ